MDGGIAGVEVCDARTGKVLFAHNADTRLLPASNAKLFTAAAALELLGEQFTWTTKVVSAQKPDAIGSVKGDVYLVGAGDASLVTADLDDLAKQIKAAGVTQIKGALYGDKSLFTDGPYGFGWEWDDFDDEEFPQISALTIDDGDVTLHAVAGAKPGDPVRVTPSSPLDRPTVSAYTVAAGTPQALHVTRPYGQRGIEVSGAMPVGAETNAATPVADPAGFAASTLRLSLGRDMFGPSDHMFWYTYVPFPFSGMPSPPPAPPDATNVLASHTSAPLSQYVTHMLKESDNLYAECLVRTVGVQKGEGGSFQSGYAAERPALQKLGVDMTNVTLVDGCGVGRRNYVTARAVCQLLMGMKKSAHYAAFYNALPIAGVDGTLKSRMKGTPAANCRAKTGTLGAVRALSGYVTGKGGTPYVFSILLNNFPGTARQAGAVQDKVVEWLAAH